jgi:hypothetical protein
MLYVERRVLDGLEEFVDQPRRIRAVFDQEYLD